MKRILAILMCSVLSGCASIVHGRSQDLSIGSSPSGATCQIAEKTITTPAIINLKRKSNYLLLCKKEGFEDSSVVVNSKLSGWYWGNIAFGLGAIITGSIDLWDGAAYKLVPDNTAIIMVRSQTAPSDSQAAH